MRITIIILLSLLSMCNVIGQNNQTIDQILDIASSTSYASAEAKTNLETATLDFQIFKGSLKPMISLEGRMPGYFQTSRAITQPNGTIAFQRLEQNNASLSLSADQVIPLTGGSIFLQSDITRFDDFTFDKTSYNGVPLRIGYVQPLNNFNQWKWRKKVIDLELESAQKSYSFDTEKARYDAAALYFQILRAAENVKIAELNSDVNERLLKIATERLALGKISENDRLQLEIELENAQLSLRQSNYEYKASIKQMWIFLGQTSVETVQYNIPETMPDLLIDPEVAVQKAMGNRPELLNYRIQQINAEGEINRAKKENGPTAQLFAGFGLARGSENLPDIYTDPFSERQINLSFSVPIFDWGNRKNRVQRAKIIHENVQRKSEQDISSIENEVRLRVMQFQLLQEAIKDQKAIRDLAEKRFDIANDRYVLGAISVTDWTLAQREKDQTRRNYISTLSSYWMTYYEIRLLTGHDFLNNQQITY